MLEYNLPLESVEGMPGVKVTLEGRFVSIICSSVVRKIPTAVINTKSVI